ncbi:hypothetical protein GOBAR_DD29715 [Gossypium barbadense]|nr:hypothetical protein GOBAR_DD29715 [Gossypium barbadense]
MWGQECDWLDNPSSSPSDLTPTVLSDTDEYHTILKNKLHQVCVIVVLFYASAMKVKGSFAQVKIQALQSEPIFKVHLIQEQGEPNDGSRVRQAIVGTNDRCAVVGKVPPNEYSFIRVPVANDPVDDVNGILEISYVNCQKLNGYVKRSKLRVLWDDSSGVENYKWLGIEFNWHPRILVVARLDVVLLLDFRHDESNVICLAKIEMLNPYVVFDDDQFLAFFRAEADGFQFVLASKILLLLCDVRKPMMPLLCWVLDLDNPCFINVIRLSELRLQRRDNTYQWATELSFFIILGSFWNCEFRLFCYGPLSTNEGSIATEISKFYKPFLSKDLSKLVCESDEFCGLILIRLMSSGKIEVQQYCAS